MGLDMYLHGRQYIGNWEHSGEAERAKFKAIVQALGIEGLETSSSPHLNVELCVAYWRKANQIHKWFVDTVQEGKDECQRSYVSREQLTTLLDLCKETLKTKDASKLPPQSGFFFGSTEVDDWYWEDIENTIKMLDKILNNEKLKDWEFSYHASW